MDPGVSWEGDRRAPPFRADVTRSRGTDPDAAAQWSHALAPASSDGGVSADAAGRNGPFEA